MEDTSTSTIATEGAEQPTATEAPAQSAQPSAESSSGESGAARSGLADAQLNAAMNGFLRSGKNDEPPTLKPDDASTAGESDTADAVDVKPADPLRGTDGRFLPRRAVPEIVQQQQTEVETLRAQLAERDPAKLREQHFAEFQQAQQQAQLAQTSTQMADRLRADADLFEAACRMTDSDPRLYEAAPNDPDGRTVYQWREDRKELIARYPEAEQALRAESERSYAQWVEADRAKTREAISASAQREGVDPERWKTPGVTWDSMAKDLADAREAKVRAELQPQLDELAQLRRDIQQLTPQALGAQRGPATAGRSGEAVSYGFNDAMNAWLRG